MRFSHIPFLLLAVVIVLLATATIVPDGAFIYTSWWMILLWTMVAVTSVFLIVKSKLIRRPFVFLLHLAFVFILIGAYVTHVWGIQGKVSLRMEEEVMTYSDSDEQSESQLPFALRLTGFHVENYPGTQSPMDYVSDVAVVEDGAEKANLHVSMNKIGEYRGYRFYQSGYDSDLKGVRLLMSYDPWGIGTTYVGYALLFISMLLLLVLPKEGFRKLLSQRKMIVLLLMFPLSLYAAPKTVPDSVASKFGNLYVYYNGRICPLQTMAKDFTVKLYGKASYEGLTAEQVLLGWCLYPTKWTEEPVIKIKSSVADLIGVNGKYACYKDFHGADGYKLESSLEAIRSGEQVGQARDILAADEKLNILLMLFNGELLKIYPYVNEQHDVEWLTQASKLPADMPEEKWLFIRKSMDYIGELAWEQDYSRLIEVVDKMRDYQQKEAKGFLPSDNLFRAEKIYNTADYTRPLAMALMTLGILSFFICLYFWVKGLPLRRWVTIGLNIVVLLALCYLLFVVTLRGYIAGHLPLSNGYETMQFMSLCTLFITLFMQRRYPLTIPFGLLLAGLTLLVAMMGESNPQITPLMPVLASPLLSVHVCVIMLAYSLLAFIMLNGVTALVLIKKKGTDHFAVSQLTYMSRLMLYPAVFCLAAGIFIGAIWANQSWGRYWGWDPKETWALITLLIYSMLLHGGSLKWTKKPVAFHLYASLAFLSILMTYFGVNFVLGGMHSYA